MKGANRMTRRGFMKQASAAAAGAPFLMAAARAQAGGGGNPYNIAVLSTAHTHTRGFMGNLASNEDRQAIYVWDDVVDRGERYAEEFDVPFEPDLDTVINDPEVDGFIICSENTRHLPLLEAAIPAGKPVFCEKPLVTTTEELSVVEDLLEAYETPLLCAYFQPFSGTMQAIQSKVRDEMFGEVTRVNARNAHHAAYGRWFDDPDVAWFTDPELAGGGAYMDMGTHAIHLVATLFGEVDEVWADIRNESGVYPDVDDYGVAMLRFKSGILGRVEAAWTQTGGIGGLEIVGSGGAVWNTPDGYRVGGPDIERAEVEAAEPQPDRVDRLIAILDGEMSEAALQTDLEATKEAVRVMEAAYKSAETGDWVEVAR